MTNRNPPNGGCDDLAYPWVHPESQPQAHFRHEASAITFLERMLWPQGPVCPRCGNRRVGRITGKGARVGLRFCPHCRRQFRVTIGTPLEGSHVPAHKWLLAVSLVLDGSMNARRVHQVLGVRYKSALNMVRLIDAALGDHGASAASLEEAVLRLAQYSAKHRRRLRITDPAEAS